MEFELRNMFSADTPNPINSSSTNTRTERNTPSRNYFSEDISTIRYELLRWAIDNQSKSIDSLRVPVNELDKLSVIDDTDDKYLKSFTETGCSEMCFPVLALLIDYKNDGYRTTENSTVTVKMLFDWERLWKHLAYDPTDSLAEHASLLRECIRFFMHDTSLKIYWVLLLYDSATDIWFASTVSIAEIEYTCLIFFRRVLFGIFYSALRRLFVDENFGRNIEQNNISPESLRGELHRQTSAAIQSHSTTSNTNWQGAFSSYSSAIFVEVRSMINNTSMTTGASSSSMMNTADLSRDIATSFVSLVNIALKYINQHCEIDIEKINKKISYVRAFRSIIFFLPLYCIGYLIIIIYDNVETCSINVNHSKCKNLVILLALRLGYVTDAIFLYLHNGAILVSIIGLTYATMLAYHMMRCWMKRYAGLRKLKFFDFSTMPATPIGMSSTSPRADNVGRRSITAESLAESLSDRQLRDLSKCLKTDASEQYLLVVEYMRQSGVVWSPVITWMYLYAVVMLLSIIYLLIIQSFNSIDADNKTIFIFSVSSVEVLLFVIFPTWSLSHVNSLIEPMRELFKIAAEDDFALLGGRELWLGYINNVAPAWTVHGLRITYSRVIGFASTLATTALTTCIYFITAPPS